MVRSGSISRYGPILAHIDMGLGSAQGFAHTGEGGWKDPRGPKGSRGVYIHRSHEQDRDNVKNGCNGRGL